MSQRKIDVVFYVPGYDEFGTTIPVTRITPAQLTQLQESVANATLPADACPTCLSLTYTDEMSFLIGGARQNKVSDKHRNLQISNLFYLAEFDDKRLTCDNSKIKSETRTTKRCATNLRNGKCRDEFMRRTIGAVLFPNLYSNEKQK